MNKLWYKQPAQTWREALPLGNGFVGMMIYGSTKKEKICFNDGTLWSGYPKNYNNKESLENLEKVRKLIFDGENEKADKLCESSLDGDYSEAFMPLGEIEIDFENTDESDLVRTLDISTAIHCVETSTIKTQAFSSNPDKVSVYKISSKKPLNLKISVKSELSYEVSIDSAINLLGNAPDYAAPHYLEDVLDPIRYNEKKGMAFCLRTEFETDGTVQKLENAIAIKNATEVTLYFVAATGFCGYDKMPETSREKVKSDCIKFFENLNKDFEYLKKRHMEDFSSLFFAQSVSFSCERDIPTDELIMEVQNGKNEKALSELFYNVGKYMTISGSRKGGQALNLQGIWNDSVRPPWSSNYTVNINTQMNYWGCSRAGLSECVEPFIQMVYETMQNGKETAKVNYGCDGFACNHNVDIWRKTPPVKGDASYMFAPLCAVWLSNEIYSHFKNGFLDEYTSKVKEIVTESARFLNCYLVMHEGKYVVCPSTSPENVFTKNERKCKLDYASSFDMGLVKQAFKNALEISDDENLKTQIKEKTPLLYPFKKGKDGICEWHEAYQTPEKGHRHFSPLYAFYPGEIIGFNSDKEKTKWIKDLFEFRLKHSGQHIGWSAAWAICLASRLRDKETVRKVIRDLLCNAIFQNLFCVHPPHYFQIDGNLGFVAGINEMLLTQEGGLIELLPALPSSFEEKGEVKNMVVNKAKVSFKWLNGAITQIQSDKPIKVSEKNLCENVLINENVSVIK